MNLNKQFGCDWNDESKRIHSRLEKSKHDVEDSKTRGREREREIERMGNSPNENQLKTFMKRSHKLILHNNHKLLNN